MVRALSIQGTIDERGTHPPEKTFSRVKMNRIGHGSAYTDKAASSMIGIWLGDRSRGLGLIYSRRKCCTFLAIRKGVFLFRLLLRA
jgi:hypothetical protein